MEGNIEYIEYRKLLNKIGQELVDDIKSELISMDKVASGGLINSISYQISGTGDNLEIDIMAYDYLTNVDEGRRPGKMPPISAIKPWVSQKGIRMTSKKGKPISDESAAFLIARSIGKNGIKPTNILSKVQSYIFSKYENDITDSIAEDVLNYTIKQLEQI